MEGKKSSFLLKVIVIGDSGVGKTNLITRFSQNDFKDTYVATIGVDFKIQTLMVGDRKLKLQIWDTAGQERFKNITQTYYKGAAGILLAYSITNPDSFNNICRWMEQIDTYAPEDVCIMLIGTKSDLEIERKIPTQRGKDLAKKYGIPFLEITSKLQKSVKQCFETLGRYIVNKSEGYDEAGYVKYRNKNYLKIVDKNNSQCYC